MFQKIKRFENLPFGSYDINNDLSNTIQYQTTEKSHTKGINDILFISFPK